MITHDDAKKLRRSIKEALDANIAFANSIGSYFKRKYVEKLRSEHRLTKEQENTLLYGMEMTKEEAIEIIKANCSCSDSKLREACAMFIPELRESEDERIIKKLQEYVKNRNWSLNGPTQAEVLDWLEKQKEKLDYLSVNRVKVRPDGGTERHTIGYLEYQKERGPLTKDEEYTLNRIIEYLEDNDCPSEWKNLLVDIHNLPYQKGDQEDNGAIDVSANFETAEREKSEFVGGHFIQCNCNLDNGLKRGEHYWLEYIGDDMYVGRSDNILNQEFHIRPRQLFTLFTQQLEETEEMHSVFKPGDKIIVQGSLVGGKYRYQNGAPITDESGRKIFDGAFVRGITFSFCGSNGSSENGKSNGSTKTTQEIFDPLADIPVTNETKKNLKKSPIPNLEDIDVDGFF